MKPIPWALFLDDERYPPSTPPSCGGEWIIARSCAAAMDLVSQRGMPTVVSFDHDLGIGLSGYDFANWLVWQDIDHHTLPAGFSFLVHSQNPIGAANIHHLLSNYLTKHRK